jgi:hypothetical protein
MRPIKRKWNKSGKEEEEEEAGCCRQAGRQEGRQDEGTQMFGGQRLMWENCVSAAALGIHR